jgi:DNA-binding NtrC family response regulator
LTFVTVFYPHSGKVNLMHLLHIDDDETLREIVASTITRYLPDISLQLASSLTLAESIVSQSNPDIIIIDQTLQDGLGLDWLKCHPDLKSTRIILMSGHDLSVEIQAFKGWNITILQKPVRPKHLVAELQAVKA